MLALASHHQFCEGHGEGGASLKRLHARHRGVVRCRRLRLLVRGVAVGSGCEDDRYFGSTTTGKGKKPSVFELSAAEAELSPASLPGDLKWGDQYVRPSFKRTRGSYVSQPIERSRSRMRPALIGAAGAGGLAARDDEEEAAAICRA